jgi:hypothetical protein
MRQLFKIDESEKRRILEMHERATRKNYLGEQETSTTTGNTGGAPTPQPTSPPELQEPVASTGTVIDGKTYKIENIKDKASLNLFLTNSVNGGFLVNRAMADIFGINFVRHPLLEPGDVERGDEATGIAFSKAYDDMDNIAQNYTLQELCSYNNEPSKITLNYPKTLGYSVDRVKNLGWCGKTDLQKRQEAKAAERKKIKDEKAAQKTQAQQQKFQQDRSKF